MSTIAASLSSGLAGRSFVLASSSPRRAYLLGLLGIDFETHTSGVDESVLDGESPTAYVERLARAKAQAVSTTAEFVLAADTTIDLDGEIIGQPADVSEVAPMLARLSGRTHLVHTGVALRYRAGGTEQIDSTVVTTPVTFFDLSVDDINRYAETGEPIGKAGGYAIQGGGVALVKSVAGSVSNVIGLPLDAVRHLLQPLLVVRTDQTV